MKSECLSISISMYERYYRSIHAFLFGDRIEGYIFGIGFAWLGIARSASRHPPL